MAQSRKQQVAAKKCWRKSMPCRRFLTGWHTSTAGSFNYVLVSEASWRGAKAHQQGIFSLVHQGHVTLGINQVQQDLKVVHSCRSLFWIHLGRLDFAAMVTSVKG